MSDSDKMGVLIYCTGFMVNGIFLLGLITGSGGYFGNLIWMHVDERNSTVQQYTNQFKIPPRNPVAAV